MPIECFHNLWHTPGFKYEYGDGRANISVQRSAAPIVAATPSMIEEATSESTSLPKNISLQRATDAPAEELSKLWMDVFIRTPDYYGYSIEDVKRDASETLSDLYDEESPSLHPSSVVAKYRGTLVALLLVDDSTARPLIAALGVRPDIQNRGVGTAMVAEVAARFREAGGHVLCSGYFLANAESTAWHEAVGFVEIPDRLTTVHRLRCAQHNLRQGLVRDVVGMKQYVEMLQADADEMSRDQREDSDAHCPFRWVRNDGERIDSFLATELGQNL